MSNNAKPSEYKPTRVTLVGVHCITEFIKHVTNGSDLVWDTLLASDEAVFYVDLDTTAHEDWFRDFENAWLKNHPIFPRQPLPPPPVSRPNV